MGKNPKNNVLENGILNEASFQFFKTPCKQQKEELHR
jgi:hypothetical protein